MLKLYDLRFKRVNVQEKSNIEKYVIRNDKNDDVDDDDDDDAPKKYYTPMIQSFMQVHVCDDDEVRFGSGSGGHPKGEQVRGRCPTELVTAPNVLVTSLQCNVSASLLPPGHPS